jgi:hypothetical protein
MYLKTSGVGGAESRKKVVRKASFQLLRWSHSQLMVFGPFFVIQENSLHMHNNYLFFKSYRGAGKNGSDKIRKSAE